VLGIPSTLHDPVSFIKHLADHPGSEGLTFEKITSIKPVSGNENWLASEKGKDAEDSSNLTGKPAYITNRAVER